MQISGKSDRIFALFYDNRKYPGDRQDKLIEDQGRKIMSFKKSVREIVKGVVGSTEFYNAEMLTVFWETKPEIVKKYLPPPLKPSSRPMVIAFIAHYPKTSFGPGYHEGGLFLRSEFNSEEGNYCLAMPVTDDMAMASGREIYGFPKKMANIEFVREEKSADGWLERHGQRFFEIHSVLSDKPASDDLLNLFADFSGSNEEAVITYLFKHFPSPDGRSFDYNPRLIRQETILRPNVIEYGEAMINLLPSKTDPWYQIEIVKLLGAVYSVGNNTMIKGDIISEVNPVKFAPYAFTKWDW